MSIFTKIFEFIGKLFSSVKKDYQNLEPNVKHFIDSAIALGNLVKGYIAYPDTAGLAGSVFIQLAEDLLGTATLNLINGVLSEVLIDMGIIVTAIEDPAKAWEELLNHLSSLKGIAFADKLFSFVKNIAAKISGIEDNNVIIALIAVVYKSFFQNKMPVISLPSTPPAEQ